MTRRPKTESIIAEAVDTLSPHWPMTLRQLFYQLVSRQVLENTRAAYKSLSRIMVGARKDGLIQWDWIEDRLRQPRHVSMWSDLCSFTDTALRSYRRDVWESQPIYVEVWVEKDALAGIFEDVIEPYGVTLNVGRGYDGWTSIRDAAERFSDKSNIVILYYGDFDPSGEDMVRSLRERLSYFGADATVTKCALTRDDINRYRLPPNLTKASDSRRLRFVAKHGDISVELDALPVDVLRARIVADIEKQIDVDAIKVVRRIEEQERQRLRKAMEEA
jgi:hypothetical protein